MTQKTTSATSGEDTRNARNDALESENHALRTEVASLRPQPEIDAENVRLHGRVQRLQGNHEALPVAILPPKPTVDLSRPNTALVMHILSFLGTSLELCKQALTSKYFGWQQLATGLDLSFVEEFARRVVCSGQNDVEGACITLSSFVRSTTTWLLILLESEYPLKFDTLLGRDIEHRNGGEKLVCATSNGISTSVVSGYVMESGLHYAEFAKTKPNLIGAAYAKSGSRPLYGTPLNLGIV